MNGSILGTIVIIVIIVIIVLALAHRVEIERQDSRECDDRINASKSWGSRDGDIITYDSECQSGSWSDSRSRGSKNRYDRSCSDSHRSDSRRSRSNSDSQRSDCSRSRSRGRSNSNIR